jgi:hypothetical protein
MFIGIQRLSPATDQETWEKLWQSWEYRWHIFMREEISAGGGVFRVNPQLGF